MRVIVKLVFHFPEVQGDTPEQRDELDVNGTSVQASEFHSAWIAGRECGRRDAEGTLCLLDGRGKLVAVAKPRPDNTLELLRVFLP